MERNTTCTSEASSQSVGEEIANAVTHGIGALLAMACLVVGVVFASIHPYHNVWNIVSVSIYGATMFLLYLFSTLYHAVVPPRAKRILNYFDHSMIYLLIAGTYTPFCLSAIRTVSPGWGWSIFGVEWGLAAMGIVFQCLCLNKWKVLSNATYLAMGWILVIAIYPVWKAIGGWALLWTAVGGVLYSVGVLFFMMKRRYMHSVWHLWVLAGTLVHYFVVLFFIVLKEPK